MEGKKASLVMVRDTRNSIYNIRFHLPPNNSSLMDDPSIKWAINIGTKWVFFHQSQMKNKKSFINSPFNGWVCLLSSCFEAGEFDINELYNCSMYIWHCVQKNLFMMVGVLNIFQHRDVLILVPLKEKPKTENYLRY